MGVDAPLIVSKRLQFGLAVLLCLLAAQCTLELASPMPAARVAITR